MATIQIAPTREFICPVEHCQVRFSRNHNLKTHLLSQHAELNPRSCFPNNFVRMPSETNYKAYVCPHPGCGRSYSMKNNCTAHYNKTHVPDYKPKPISHRAGRGERLSAIEVKAARKVLESESGVRPKCLLKSPPSSEPSSTSSSSSMTSSTEALAASVLTSLEDSRGLLRPKSETFSSLLGAPLGKTASLNANLCNPSTSSSPVTSPICPLPPFNPAFLFPRAMYNSNLMGVNPMATQYYMPPSTASPYLFPPSTYNLGPVLSPSFPTSSFPSNSIFSPSSSTTTSPTPSYVSTLTSESTHLFQVAVPSSRS